MEHLVPADRGWHCMMGEQVPESFIISQLLGFLLLSAKRLRQADVTGKQAAVDWEQNCFIAVFYRDKER